MNNLKVGYWKAYGSDTKNHAFEESKQEELLNMTYHMGRPLCGSEKKRYIEIKNGQINCKKCLRKLEGDK